VSDRTSHVGKYGTAVETFPTYELGKKLSVVQWLLTAPQFHPCWTQYLLLCDRLIHVEGIAEPMLVFPEATHEVLVVALDPSNGVLTPESIEEKLPGYLTPVNIDLQFKATDAEMKEVMLLLAMHIVIGLLDPESSNYPEQCQVVWRRNIEGTLEHMRGKHD
jgi:hypothetical protein